MTNNLNRRIQEHRTEGLSGYCGKWHITKLVYFEEYGTAFEAIQREKQLKGWSREKKLDLVASVNPKWEDLMGVVSL